MLKVSALFSALSATVLLTSVSHEKAIDTVVGVTWVLIDKLVG